MKFKITPKGLILGHLQASVGREVQIKSLVVVGDLFGFTGNTIRVTATRLIRDGKLESSERGLYRLGRQIDPYSRFIESWRTGEDRLIPWDGSWICYLIPPMTARKQDKVKKSLIKAGFREGTANLWIRPNNLRIGLKGIKNILKQLQSTDSGELFIGNTFNELMSERWKRFLWPVDELLETQQQFLNKIEQSAERVERLPRRNALVESFLIGSEAVFLLITDPLLPEEMMPGDFRRKLTRAMQEYDKIGKRIWNKLLNEIGIHGAPSYLSFETDLF